MVRRFAALFSVVFVALFLFAGCSNEVDKAIQKLGGTPAEQEEALGTIQVSAQDPMPRLIKAVSNKKLSPLARKNVALLIGSTSEKTGDETAVPALAGALKDSEEDVQLAILDAIEKIPGKKSVEALQGLLEDKNEKVSGMAWDILDTMAGKKEGEADAIDGEASIPRKIELMKQAAAFNPRNQRIIEKLAELYNLQGESDKAKDLYNGGGKFVYAVKVIGPFNPNEKVDFFDPKNFDTSQPAGLMDGTQLNWIDFKDIPENGSIDFRRDPATKVARAIFYISFNIDSKVKQDVLLKLSTISELKMWVDGELAFEASAKEARSMNEHEIKLSLEKGKNKVLLKLRTKRYPKLSIRVSDLKHKKINSVDYSL